MPDEFAYPTPIQIDQLISSSHSLRHQDTRKALELCMHAQKLSLKIDYQHGYAKSLFLTALCRHILGHQDQVIETVEEAMSLFRSMGDETGIGNSYNLIGHIHDRNGFFIEAIEAYQKSLEVRRRIGDKDGESGSLNNIGTEYIQLAQFSLAFENLFESYKLAESISNPSGASYALMNIGSIFAQIGQLDDALEYYQHSLEMNQGTSDRALDSTILADIGKIHALLKNHKDAIISVERSLKLSQQTGNLLDEGYSLSSMGAICQEDGQHAAAENHLNSALKIMAGANSRAGQAEVLHLIGKGYMYQGKYNEAISHLKQSLKLAGEINLNSEIRNNHQFLAEVYKATGDFEQALEHFQIFHGVWKEHYSRDTERRIHAILAHDKYEKIEREAEEHRTRTNELSQTLSEMKKTEDEKNQLLRQLEAQAKMLEQLAREDGLTGMSNRRYLDFQINREFERAKRFARPFTIAMIDLDNFKSINDQISHLTGDDVLRETAKLLRSSCRSVDVIGRFGGEEFTILFIETTVDQANEICQKIMKKMREHSWKEIHPKLDKVTVSIGLGGNTNIQSATELIRIADQELYRAKNQGKDRVCHAAS